MHAQAATPTTPDPSKQAELDRKRKEWRQGLKEYIQQQRGPTGQEEPSAAPSAAVPLTWQELKFAAEAGFDELLRAQEEAAATGADDADTARRYRSPYKSPLRGGACHVMSTHTCHRAVAWPRCHPPTGHA